MQTRVRNRGRVNDGTARRWSSLEKRARCQDNQVKKAILSAVESDVRYLSYGDGVISRLSGLDRK